MRTVGSIPATPAEGCSVCAFEHPRRRAPELVAWEDSLWIVRHHMPPSPLVGWFMLISRRHFGGPADLSESEALFLGPTLRRVSQAIKAVTGAPKVYAIAFGEGAPHLHVHLVPRYADRPDLAAWKLADVYRDVEGGELPAADPDLVRASVRSLGALLGRR